MSPTIILFVLISAFIIAKLEIQIEGKDGGAKNLPTWRIKNNWTRLILGNHPFTGYHFWAFLALFTFLHLPFFIGISWNLKLEITILTMLLLITLAEDFLWFILNPNYGIKRFNSRHVSWHRWIGPVPMPYFVLILGIISLQIFNYYFL